MHAISKRVITYETDLELSLINPLTIVVQKYKKANLYWRAWLSIVFDIRSLI